jgi:ribokinase
MARIVVLGSLNVDLVVQVPHLPSHGETVMGTRLEIFPGGKGANQAVAAARLGGEVEMLGRVGQDAHGSMLLDALETGGVHCEGVRHDGQAPTGAALIMVQPGGQNIIAVAPGANAQVGSTDVERTIALLGSDDILLLQLEVPAAAVFEAAGLARGRGARVLLNAAPASALTPEQLSTVDVLIVNELEAEELFGQPVRDVESGLAAARTGREQGTQTIVITLGAQGAVVCDGDGATTIPPFRVQPVDATAAGDAFAGALAVALSQGLQTRHALRLANAAGAVTATRVGAQSSLPTAADLKRQLGIDGGSAAISL